MREDVYMIYNLLNSYANIKKIPIRIWKFRDHFESLIRRYMILKDKSELTIDELHFLRQQYQEHSLLSTHFSHVENQPSSEIPADFFHDTHLTLPREQMGNGSALLTDINLSRIIVFSSLPFTLGQTVEIELLLPVPFVLSAEVEHCIVYNMQSRIISNVRPNFRINGRLIFYRTGERTLLRELVRDIDKIHNSELQKMQPLNKEAKA